jgi:hypothetical protein
MFKKSLCAVGSSDFGAGARGEILITAVTEQLDTVEPAKSNPIQADFRGGQHEDESGRWSEIVGEEHTSDIPLFIRPARCGGVLLSNSSAKADTTAYNFTGTLANNVGTVNGTFTLDFVNAREPAFDLTTPVAVFSSANSSTGTLFQYTPAFSRNMDFMQLSFRNASDTSFLNLSSKVACQDSALEVICTFKLSSPAQHPTTSRTSLVHHSHRHSLNALAAGPTWPPNHPACYCLAVAY